MRLFLRVLVATATVAPLLCTPLSGFGAGKLTARDNALYILRNGIKSADFVARGMAYQGLSSDRGNKELKQILEDGIQDPQWVVRQGVAEAYYDLHDSHWKDITHVALATAILSPYEVLPILDRIADKDAFGVLIETLADKENQQQDKIITCLIGLNRPNLGAFLKTALATKDELVVQSALKGVAQLDPALQGAHLDLVARAQAANDAVCKALADVAASSDQRAGVAFLAPLKPKDAALAARIVVLRAQHGDRTVGKALIKICQSTAGEEQLAALSAYRQVADKSDAEDLKGLLAHAPSSQLVYSVYEILARMGDRSMASEAQKLADSTDVDVRATGVFYLGWVGGAGRIREMHQYLNDGIADVRVAAARVLGYIASPISVMPLREAVEIERDDKVRIELIRSLASIKDKSAYEALMFFTREKDADLRRVVVRALAESGDSQTRRGLDNALNDNDVRIRTEAVRGFILSDVAKAAAVWKRAVRWLPRGALLDLTRELNKTMEGFIELALFDTVNDDAGIALREEALVALHLLPEAEPALLRKVLLTSDDEDLQVRVLRRLFEIEGKKAGTEVKAMALSSAVRVRVAGVRLLGQIRSDKEAADMLLRFLDEPDERIRIAAALTFMGG